MSLSLQLAEIATAVRYADLRPEVVQAAKVSLVDALAVMAAATGLEPAAAAFADHAEALGAGPCRLVGRAQTVTPPAAALANGALAHAVDFEDTFEAGKIHPNASVVPAVLALAEASGASGEQLITALAVGCDFACRLSLALADDPAQHGWYHPPMLSGMGAALAAAQLLELTPQQAVDALGLAATQFALGTELIRTPGSDMRAVRDGFAARAAVEAALLARLGVRAVDAPLEGPSGLARQLTGRDIMEAPLLEGFGRHFLGPEVGVKRWPSCRGTHSAIWAASRLTETGITAADIAGVEVVATPPNDMLFEPRPIRIAPRAAIEAKFSVPFVFASTVHRGEPTLASFAPERLGEAVVVELAGRVRMTALRSLPEAEAIYTVRLGNGGPVEIVVPPLPVWQAGGIALADLEPKLAACAAMALRPFDPRELVSAVEQIETTGASAVMTLL